MIRLDQTTASHMAGIALGHVTKPYPHKLDHVWSSDADATPPRQQHPIFYGSFDWHSCVHGWWTLLTLLRLFPALPEAAAIRALADNSFTPAKIDGELAYVERPESSAFERPYGQAWLLQLQLEAGRHDAPWGERLAPLANPLAARLARYFAIMTYPIRTGTHANSAFAMRLSLDWADANDPALAGALKARAEGWFGGDRDCQAWEPGGDEFLSSALSEALLMRRVLGPEAFGAWFAAFLPRAAAREPGTLFTPATVSDRSDGKIAHLDGLNLSRAWAWRGIADALDPAAAKVARDTADEHLASAWPHLTGDYAGEHWLASFALLALLAGEDADAAV